ncbi:MAG TPA: protein kinase [Gemmatimonadales bacterium]|nr:protein kinase [Gemmatimonadales bacterium]
MPEPVVGSIADRYALLRKLGRGGMGTVWLARDGQHDRLVAIKLLHPELAGVVGGDRFLREIRVTAQLQHPNIVPMLDSGVIRRGDGTEVPWYAMPYLEGESLRARLTREPQLPLEDALRITDLVSQALQAAHRHGIVHRDIKPENVLLSAGSVYVVDFGIAKAAAEVDAERLTSTGLSIGTPAYMSPEQASGDKVDARSDQYSLATMLYEMLVGEPPFAGRSAQAIVARRLTETARAIRPVRPGVPFPVERAILKALERSPADRFADLGAFSAALRDTAATSVPSVTAKPSSPRRLVVLGLLVLLLIGVYSFLQRGSARAQARDPDLIALYQRGLEALGRRTQTGTTEAAQTFSAVLAKDSSFGDAWTGLAQTYTRADLRGFVIPGVPPDSLIDAAVRAVDRALALDSNSAAAWRVRSTLNQRIDPTDDTPALRSIRHAIALDSTQPESWHYLGMYLTETGDPGGGITAWHRCLALSPTNTQCLAFLGLAYYWRRQYDSAAMYGDSAVSIDPGYYLGRTSLAATELSRGNTGKAVAAFDAALRLSSGVETVNAIVENALAVSHAGDQAKARKLLVQAESLGKGYRPFSLHTAVYFAETYAGLGDATTALRLLRDYQPRADLHFQLHLRCDPLLDPVADNPAFQSLLLKEMPRPPHGC